MNFLNEFWEYTVLVAPYLLFGLTVGGLIHTFVKIDTIKKQLGNPGVGSVVKASLFGIPLPLCSCSVIPTAVTLRKAGASNGATSSFLIATPESGVDSIAMTYGMMDLPMTIIRPIAAFFTSTIAGFLQSGFNDFEMEKEEEKKSSGGCCKKKAAAAGEAAKESRGKKVFNFAFNDLSDDISWWLFIGILIGALLNAFLPDQFFDQLTGWQGKALMTLVGIPLYICASATTPIAASLVLKGMSPGTALILLLVGPATNLANLSVLQKYIGKKGVVINIITIAVVAIIFSIFIDWAYTYFAWPLSFRVAGHEHAHLMWYDHLMGGFLLLLIVKGIYKEKVKPLLKRKPEGAACH